MQKNKILTIPNILSFYRLFTFPVILWFIISGKETLFAVFLIINLVTDVLDGYIARRLNQQTAFGARLDSMADNLTFALAIIGILVFKIDDFRPHLISFFIFIVLGVLLMVLSLIKFGRFPSFHLYSFKIGGYIQGFFLAVLFTFGFITVFYYFMIIWAILAALEHIVIQLIIPEMRSNVKGLYWILRERRS